MRIKLIIFIILTTSLSCFAKARYLTCPERFPQTIKVPFGDVMIMEFPEKPKQSLPGKTQFDFQYIGNDIGIKGLQLNATANLFVYLGKKRCAFRLVSTQTKQDDIVVISYPKEKIIEAKYVK